MQQIPFSIVSQAESSAQSAGLEGVLEVLRQLSLDDFGRFMISLPNDDFPRLSELLPAMASAEIQKKWTGSSGVDLLKQTLAFTKQVEVNVVRHGGKPLRGNRILDFGCGYGRFIRMLYYFTNPSNIWAVDAWEKSIATCRDAGVAANFAISDRIPKRLPVGDVKFDVAFAFSVFTHLSPAAAKACLSAIRKSMNAGGLFIATIRPVEFWPFIDKMRSSNCAEKLIEDHRIQGFAYLPHNGAEGETYGDFSCEPEFMQQAGWRLAGYDSSIMDSYQVSVLLEAT